jgi:hypothetical protein
LCAVSKLHKNILESGKNISESGWVKYTDSIIPLTLHLTKGTVPSQCLNNTNYLKVALCSRIFFLSNSGVALKISFLALSYLYFCFAGMRTSLVLTFLHQSLNSFLLSFLPRVLASHSQSSPAEELQTVSYHSLTDNHAI